jgi:hypothetical protein
MPGPIAADRVKQQTTTSGTGTLNLEAAVPDGAISFVAGVGNANTCYYCISHLTANEWEVGIGTVTDAATDTLSRTTVLASSNGGSVVNLSAGTKDVFVVAPAHYGLPLIALPTTHAVRRERENALVATVGDARGTGAFDAQSSRTAANQVASGNYSAVVSGLNSRASNTGAFIGAGRNNIASAVHTVVGGGRANTASQNYASVVGGYGNTAGGSTYSFVGGGSSNSALAARAAVVAGASNTASGGSSFVGAGAANTASGLYSGVPAGHQATASKRAQLAHASGRFAANGDAQTSQYVVRRQTTNATPAEMFLNGSSERITLANDTTYAFEILLVARRADANDESAAYRYVGCIDRNATAGTTALVGSVTETVIAEDTAAWAAAVTADSTNGALVITVTGEGSKTINWVAFVRTVEVTG